jgi:hypothetical protein
MSGDSKHLPGYAHRTPLDYPRGVIEIIATLGLALILFLLLLFATQFGTEITRDGPDEPNIKTGFNGL